MVENQTGPYQKHKNDPEEQDAPMEDEDIPDEVENEEGDYPESAEFQEIDDQLNMLNSVLDNLEQKNDDILAELTSLLNENREIRKQLQECQSDPQNEENSQPNK